MLDAEVVEVLRMLLGVRSMQAAFISLQSSIIRLTNFNLDHRKLRQRILPFVVLAAEEVSKSDVRFTEGSVVSENTTRVIGGIVFPRYRIEQIPELIFSEK